MQLRSSYGLANQLKRGTISRLSPGTGIGQYHDNISPIPPFDFPRAQTHAHTHPRLIHARENTRSLMLPASTLNRYNPIETRRTLPHVRYRFHIFQFKRIAQQRRISQRSMNVYAIACLNLGYIHIYKAVSKSLIRIHDASATIKLTEIFAIHHAR